MRFHAQSNMEGMMPNVANKPPYQQGYVPSFDDERRIADILRNKNPTSFNGHNPFGTKTEKIDSYDPYSNRKPAFGQRTYHDPNDGHVDFGRPFFRNPYVDVNRLNLASDFDRDLHSYKALTVHNRPFEIFSKPILTHDTTGRNKSPTDFRFWSDPFKHRNAVANHQFDRHRQHGFLDNAYKNHGIVTRPKQNELIAGKAPNIGNSYNFDDVKISYGGFKDTPAIWTPFLLGAFRDFGVRINGRSKCKCQSDLVPRLREGRFLALFFISTKTRLFDCPSA